MLARFLDEDHIILKEVGDFTVNHYNENEDLIKEEVLIDTTFNNIGYAINKLHNEGVTMSVLDYGDEYRTVLTPNSEGDEISYVVIMHN